MALEIDSGACVRGHTIYIYDRGGMRRLFQLRDVSQVSWGRVRDDISNASILMGGSACSAQAENLAKIEPKRHELVIFRGDLRVWEGPISRVAWHSDGMEIAAQDVAAYAFARPLTKTWSNAGKAVTTATQRFKDIFNYEMSTPFSFKNGDGTSVSVPAWESLDPPANVLPFLQVHHFTNEARTSAVTVPFQYTVGEHLDNHAQSGGIDYVTIGRAIHIWDTSRPIGRGKTLTEVDFEGEIIITAYGADHAEMAFTVTEDGRYGGAGNTSSYYGPWAKIFPVYDEDESNPPTQTELNSQAKRNLVGRSPVPVEVRVPDNSTIRLSDSLGINDLVPGTFFPLVATLNARQMTQMQKLHTMHVVESEGNETVSVSFVPAGRSDSDEVSE